MQQRMSAAETYLQMPVQSNILHWKAAVST